MGDPWLGFAAGGVKARRYLHDHEALVLALTCLLTRANVVLGDDDRARIEACVDAATPERWIGKAGQGRQRGCGSLQCMVAVRCSAGIPPSPSHATPGKNPPEARRGRSLADASRGRRFSHP